MNQSLNEPGTPVTATVDDVSQWALRDCGLLEHGRDPELDRWVAALGRNAGVAAAALCLFDGSDRPLKSVWPVPAAPVCRLADGESFASRLRELVAGPGAAGCLVAEQPVIVGERAVGQVGIADATRAGWSADDLAALAEAAAAISAQIQARLATAKVARVQQLVASHNRVHEMSLRREPLREVLAAACEAIEAYDPSLMLSVLLRDPESNTLHSAVGPSLPQEYLDAVEGAPIGPNIGACGQAAWFGRLMISEDIDSDPHWGPIRGLAQLAGVRHCWSMPIKGSDEAVLGTLALYGRSPRRPQQEHLALMQDWAHVAGAAIERAQSFDQLTHDARHDGLTGLPNRVAVLERLDHALTRVRPDAAVAVLFVDLDGLKVLNDAFGHDMADEVLRTMGNRLATGVRNSDFVGRFGGDEFIVIAEGVAEPDEVGALGARLLEAVAQPLTGLTSVVVTASIGIALVRSNELDARDALRKADAAMYEAKRAGKDRCVFAEVGGTVRAGRRLQLARELRGAEARGELQLVYQPIVDLPGRRIAGVEALLRWTNPAVGEVEPAEFIPVAEDTGSMVPIGAWVLRESCDTIARFSKDGHGVELSVNISPCQLSHPDFPLWVRQTLAHAELPADKLILDITEACLARPDEIALRNQGEVRSLGVRIALDNLGAGNMSLSWLRDGLVDIVKIDPSLVGRLRHQRDRTIVAALIDIAHAVGCTVTAEGVETEAQLQSLERMRCGRAQGFHVARPHSAAHLPALLAGSAARVPAPPS